MNGFCTCADYSCPLNPANHDKGCDLCIQKCLKLGEIPSCFFNAVCAAEIPGLCRFCGEAPAQKSQYKSPVNADLGDSNRPDPGADRREKLKKDAAAPFLSFF